MLLQSYFRVAKGAQGEILWTSRRTLVTSTARIMLPDDANPAGNVHGGSILRLIDECGIISASRHASDLHRLSTSKVPLAALARVDRVDFENPMHIGDLAQLDARVTATGRKSMEVQVNVTAETLATGAKTRTNKATLWYVLIEDDGFKGLQNEIPPKLRVSSLEVPPLHFASEEKKAEAKARYVLQKSSRIGGNSLEPMSSIRRPDSRPVLSQCILSSDCYQSGCIYGGVVMKLMDTAGGVTGMKYCGTNVVTASIESLNMLAPIFLGNIVSVYAHPTFTSARTLEVAVYVEAENVHSGQSWQAFNAHLTFVSLSTKGEVLTVPPLVPHSHESRVDFELGKQRYLKRKVARA